MKVAHLDGVRLAYELVGAGEPLLLIHGSNLADGLSPLASALAREAPWLRVLRYHRRGYGATAAVDVPASVDQHAADALGLLDSLGMRSAHVLGYSYGGVLALEAALMAPTRIRSLTLLEPILLEVPSAGDFMARMAPVMSRYTNGDMEGAVTATLAALGGPKWQDLHRHDRPRCARHGDSRHRHLLPIRGAFAEHLDPRPLPRPDGRLSGAVGAGRQ